MTSPRIEELPEEVVRLLKHYGKCRACHGTGEFDHGAGEGRIEKCIPGDRSEPPHRYCPCETCEATGLADDVRAVLDRLSTGRLIALDRDEIEGLLRLDLGAQFFGTEHVRAVANAKDKLSQALAQVEADER